MLPMKWNELVCALWRFDFNTFMPGQSMFYRRNIEFHAGPANWKFSFFLNMLERDPSASCHTLALMQILPLHQWTIIHQSQEKKQAFPPWREKYFSLISLHGYLITSPNPSFGTPVNQLCSFLVSDEVPFSHQVIHWYQWKWSLIACP